MIRKAVPLPLDRLAGRWLMGWDRLRMGAHDWRIARSHGWISRSWTRDPSIKRPRYLLVCGARWHYPADPHLLETASVLTGHEVVSIDRLYYWWETARAEQLVAAVLEMLDQSSQPTVLVGIGLGGVIAAAALSRRHCRTVTAFVAVETHWWRHVPRAQALRDALRPNPPLLTVPATTVFVDQDPLFGQGFDAQLSPSVKLRMPGGNAAPETVLRWLPEIHQTLQRPAPVGQADVSWSIWRPEKEDAA